MTEVVLEAVAEGEEAFTEAKLVDYIANLARRTWEAEQPFFLSNLAPALKEDGFNYRDVTGDRSLGAWAREVHQDQWTVVRHPQQLSKIGVVPAGVQFSFEEAEATQDPEQPNRSRKKPVVIRFLEELAKLDQAELEKVNIPVSVIVKLLNV